MRIGYACVNTQLPSSARTVRLAPWSAAVYVRDFEDGSIT